MRISDWSSDVCSSDLCLAGHARSPAARHRRRLARLGAFRRRLYERPPYRVAGAEWRRRLRIDRCVGMTMRGLIHHIDLTVSDKERSRAFYDAVLGFLGYRRSADYDQGSRSEERSVGKELIITGKFWW